MNEVKKHFNNIAKDYDYFKNRSWYYYKNLKKLLKSLIPIEKRVLEIGCGTGDLIASLKACSGYGMDLSDQMIRLAKQKHKNNELTFSTKYPKDIYDYIFMSDVLEHLEQPTSVFKQISLLMDKDSVFINTMANPIWEPVLMIAEKLGLKMPEGKHKRIGVGEISKLLNKVGLKIVKHDYKLLMPIYVPYLSGFVNRSLERYFKKYAFIEYFVAKKS